MNEARLIGKKTLLTYQQVEHGNGKGQTSFNVGPNTVHAFLEAVIRGQIGGDGFNNHAFIMVKCFTYHQISWILFFLIKFMVRENNVRSSKR